MEKEEISVTPEKKGTRDLEWTPLVHPAFLVCKVIPVPRVCPAWTVSMVQGVFRARKEKTVGTALMVRQKPVLTKD